MTTVDTEKLERGWALIAEGAQTISLAYAAIEQSGRVASPALRAPDPADDLPAMEPSPDELLEAVVAVTGGEVVPPTQPVQRQLAKESAFTACPAHRKPFTKGKFGDYCQSASEEDGWSNPKGFCTVTPRSAGAWLKQHPRAA